MQPIKLDTLTLVATPEAVDIVLRPAGLIPRSLAFLIDFIIRSIWAIVTTFLIFLIFKGSEQLSIGLFILNIFFILWLYSVFFEVLFQGKTLGKKIMGLRVIHDDGTPIGFAASMLRNLLRIVDALPFFYSIGIFVMCLHPDAKRIGDIVAGSLVVYDDAKKKLQVIPAVPAVESLVMLTKEEQQAFVLFAEKSVKLAPERQQELALIITSSLGVHSYEGVDTILGIARNIVGEKHENFET